MLLKKEVERYWNQASCGTEFIKQQKFSEEYFAAIEQTRYSIEPEIFSFAQFTRFHNKKVLEVGVGAGTDFTQWVRAGAHAHGVDLTKEAVDNTQARLALQNLQAASLLQADAESLPYEDNMFDLVYSWGVIHHSPNTEQCLSEIVRVAKPGAQIKVMVYHRRSLFALYQWIRSALLQGKPLQSVAKVLWHHQESKGTKAYTKKEMRTLCRRYGLAVHSIQTPLSNHDVLYYNPLLSTIARFLTRLFGIQHAGWFMMINATKAAL